MNVPAVVVALTTPFGDPGSPDLEALHGHVEFLAEREVDAVMVSGTTGEGPLLTDDEVVEITGAAVTAAAGRVEVLAHVGRPGTVATVRLARRAIDAGAGGVSAVTPYYYSLDDEQLVEHYRALVTISAEVPAYAYTIPARTGNDLSPEAAVKLAEAGLFGLKDSTKSLDRHREYLEVTRDRPFRVLMGSDGLVLDALRAGAAGCISAVANARPDLPVGVTRAFLNQNEREAERSQEELSVIREELSRGPTLVGVKRATARALGERGVVYPEGLRPPLG